MPERIVGGERKTIEGEVVVVFTIDEPGLLCDAQVSHLEERIRQRLYCNALLCQKRCDGLLPDRTGENGLQAIRREEMESGMIELQVVSSVEKLLANHEVVRDDGIHGIQMGDPAAGNG